MLAARAGAEAPALQAEGEEAWRTNTTPHHECTGHYRQREERLAAETRQRHQPALLATLLVLLRQPAPVHEPIALRWLVSGLVWAGWCWFVMREKHCWLVK